MKKLIIGALAALTALVATPAMAAPVTPPSHVKMTLIRVGHMVNGVVPIATADNKVMNVTISGCEVSWTDNDLFYAIAAPGTGVYVIPKKVLDYAWTRTNEDWDVSFQVLVKANMVCSIGPANYR